MRVRSRSLLVVLALLTGGCEAQVPPNTRAPVNVAIGLYSGCLIAQAQVDGPAEPYELKQPKLVSAYIRAVDDYCLTWTVIWYKPLMDDDLASWPGDRVIRFNSYRSELLQSFANAYIGKR